MKVFIVSCLLFAAAVSAAPSVIDNKIESEGTLSRAAKYLGACFESDDITTCLAVKGITAMNRAARSNNIVVTNGITFKRDPASPVARNGKALSENDIMSELPSESEDRNGRLMDMAMQSVADFFGSHNLEVKVPSETTQEVARAIEEGRGKMKKLMGPLILAVGAKLFALVPLLLGGLALLATKAIVVAKIAFLLALAVSASKLFGGAGKLGGLGGLGGGAAGLANSAGWQQPAQQGWSSGGASYPYARSLGDDDSSEDAQELAFHAQIPAQ
ncbi:uncharacterized protein LOC129916462 [Episyrphus balteatus]|uniref:uncharacterized protein LOC129916462 n=1 Tax=Episyrphus balteatus TaxID=286459 RepID=UPI002485CB43|nr:uncharacterized protein LOC129916462 [Episyrphus balteatus]